jgi:hypothetical protein
MRHLLGIALAVVTAAAVFFAASWGYIKLFLDPARSSVLQPGSASLIHDHVALEGFGALLGAGLVVGIMIAVPRISPLASGLPGLVLLAWTGLYLFSARRAVRYIPLKTHPFGAGFESMLTGGVLAMVGLAMIIPMFVPSRWRGGPAVAEPAPYGADTYPGFQDTQTMSDGGGLLSDWAQTRPQPQSNPGTPQAPWGPADSGGPAGTGGPVGPADYS